MTKDIVRDLLKKAIAIAGSQAKLGKACARRVNGELKPYSQNAIYIALKTGEVSPTLAVRIEQATNGAVLAVELCPELYEWLTTEHNPQSVVNT